MALQPRFYRPLGYTALTNNVPAVQFTVTRHLTTVQGGPESAELLCSGHEDELIALFNLLAHGVELISDEGDRVWWGRVNEVRVTIGAMVVGLTLNTMSNKVAVAYTLTDPITGTSGERLTTAYIEDTFSESLYGIKELLQTLSSGTAAQANALQAMLLDRQKMPTPTLSMAQNGRGAPKAIINCLGWYSTLENRYANVSVAAPAYTVQPSSPSYSVTTTYGITQSEDIGISIGKTSTIQQLAFDLPNTIVWPCVWKRIKVKLVRTGASVDNLLIDLRLGTASAPGTILHTITVPTATISTTANTVMEFTPTDNVYRVPGVSYCITVRRSGAVDATKYVDIMGLTTLTNPSSATYTYNGTTWALAGMDTFYDFSEEAPDYSVDLNALTARGRIAIPFTVSSALAVGSVRVPLAKFGSPTGNVDVFITVDSAGSPGAVIATQSLPASGLTNDYQDVLWDALSANTVLTPATTYWLQIWPTGTTSAAAFIRVLVNPALGYAGGDPKIYNGSAWVALSPNADMLFSLGLVQETTEQIKQLATTYGQFITGIDIDTVSNVWTNPARNGDVTVRQCIDEMLDSGTSAGVRLLADVSADRRLRIYAEPTAASVANREYQLLRDGRLVNAMNVPVDKSTPVVGVWCKFRDILPEAINQALFIEQAEYMAQQDAIAFTTRGSIDPMDAFKIQRG
jgi:hypothetical protein